MRGPDLVGYPPDGLRWSADSQKLYFDWRKPGEDEASTYVVGRDGGDARKLTDDQKKNAPPANGRWDKAHKRVLFADGGDIVMLDGARYAPPDHADDRRREQPALGEKRHARSPTSSDGNLFIVPVDAGVRRASCTQLTDVAPKKIEPRLTDSQKFIRDEEEKLIEALRRAEGQEEEGRRQGRRRTSCRPSSSRIVSRRVDLMLSPDDTHVFILVAERPAGARNIDRAELRQRNRLHRRHPRPHRRRRRAESPPAGGLEPEDRQVRVGGRQLRAAGRRAECRPPDMAAARPRLSRPENQHAAAAEKRSARSAGRCPIGLDDGKLAVAARTSADNKDRWYVTLDPDTGKTRVVDTLHDDAWIREAGGGLRLVRRRVPARQQARVVLVRARRLDAPLHA